MRQSQLFSKTKKEAPKDEVSRNAELLIRAGYIDKVGAGVYTFLPLGLRVLNKIESIIREEMNKVGGEEIFMPALQPKQNWEITERWTIFDVLFKLKGSGDREYALGATHEEIVTPLAKKYINSYKDLPKALYQIQTKFRDEPRAKSGVLRGREFRMKDLYSFHANEADVDAFYEIMKQAYFNIYKRCGLQDVTYVTYASGGTFSKWSHEFQTVSPSGEDVIYVSPDKSFAVNKEVIDQIEEIVPGLKKDDLKEERAIEVGNIFKLGTKYSKPFELTYVDEAGKEQPVLMSCFGIGSSRLMGTLVEVFNDADGIVWPATVSPFQVHLISLCKEAADIARADELYNALLAQNIEVLYDDRLGIQAGEKFADADLIGIHKQAIISAKTLAQSAVEVRNRSNKKDSKIVSLDDVNALK